MDMKEATKLVRDLLDALPSEYQDNHVEFARRHGYLIGLLASIMVDDFHARRVVSHRYNEVIRNQSLK